MTDLVISIINYKTKDLTEKCLNSILDKNWKTKYEIWVIDNASNDGSLEYLKKKFTKINFIESDKNLGYAGGHNLVLKKAKGQYFLILNSDTEVLDQSLDNLVEFMKSSNFGIASCKLVNSDNSLQPNGGDLPNFLNVFIWLAGLDDILIGLREYLPSFHLKFISYYKGDRKMGWVGGTAMIIKQEVINKIGLLDDNIFMYAEDSEYCLRADRNNINIGWTDKAVIKHLSGGSLDQPKFRQWLGELNGLIYIYKKYYGFLATFALKILIYLFTIIRIFAFFILGEKEVSKTYAKVIISI